MKKNIRYSVAAALAIAVGFSGCGDDYQWDTDNTSKLEGQYTPEKIAEYDAEGIWFNANTRGVVADNIVKSFYFSNELTAGISVSIKYHDDGDRFVYHTENNNSTIGLNGSPINYEADASSKYDTAYNYSYGCAELNASNLSVMLAQENGGKLDKTDSGLCQIPMSTTHRFKVGSLTKTAVSRTILDMDDNENGYPGFSINDAVTDHLPSNITALGDLGGITVSHLLHHTSGIGDINVTSLASVEDKLREALAKERTTEPGQMYSYNNAGYIILGQVIEHLGQTQTRNTNDTWQNEVTARMREAVDSNASFYFPEASTDENYTSWLSAYDTNNSDVNQTLARGYKEGFIDNTDRSSADIAYSAGSLIASVPDITKWMESIATNDNTIDGNTSNVGLLSTDYFVKNVDTINTANYADIYLGSTNWNLGPGIGYDQDQNSLFHLGLFEGYACHSVYSKNEEVTVTVCVNGNADLKKLPYQILETMYPYRTKFLPTTTTTH